MRTHWCGEPILSGTYECRSPLIEYKELSKSIKYNLFALQNKQEVICQNFWEFSWKPGSSIWIKM